MSLDRERGATPTRNATRTAVRPGEIRGRILLVDDEEVISEMLQEFLQSEGFDVAVASDGPSALQRVESFEPDLALCDVQLPGIDGLELLDRLLRVRPETLVLMITAYATVENAVAAFRRGAQDYMMKPVIFDELLAKIDHLLSYRRLVRENQALRRQLHAEIDADRLVANGPEMQSVMTLIRKVGPTRSNVLITGDSGTGKELVARALHARGPDPDAPYLAINCAAIAHESLESQLFGHIRGFFAGADRDHAGLFIAAGSGTVFLDEVGELSPATQAKLLRSIETKEVLPTGATRPVAFAARVLAATNKELTREVAEGRFRADLFYRLNVVSIHLPPLRDRPEDIPELIDVLLAKHARRLGKRVDGVDNETVRRLSVAPWKGNVRELDNALERAVILCDGPILTPGDFPAELVAGPGGPDLGDDLRAALAQFESRHIRRVLDSCEGDKREAAKQLGLGLSSLYRKLEEHDLR